MATTTTQPTNNARTVAGLMAIAVAFSLLGNEIKVANGASKDKLSSGLSKGATIIVGGFIAGGLLIGVSGAGEAGRKFSVGLATVVAVTSLLVYGKPVWDGISNVVGGTPTTPTGATAATANTTPTHGTATAVALTEAL